MADGSCLQFFGAGSRAPAFLDSLREKNFAFALVISYTETCEVPGITIAGADRELLKLTPPADAEYLHYGYCKTINQVPMTPDGKPTPALLSRAALEHSGIPRIVINAGSKVAPQLPYVETGLRPGRDISKHPAMDTRDAMRAVEYGRMVGENLAAMSDCLVIGECVPGGTTTAAAVLRALGHDARVSSSMPENPVLLKDGIVSSALARLGSDDPLDIVARVGDPMLPFAAGMACAASHTSKVMLAGGTQMAAVLALASMLGFAAENSALATTTYVTDDSTANLAGTIRDIADVPAVAVDPGLHGSGLGGLRAFSEGFAKEGVGAGGCILSSMLKSGTTQAEYLRLAEAEYRRLLDGD